MRLLGSSAVGPGPRVVRAQTARDDRGSRFLLQRRPSRSRSVGNTEIESNERQWSTVTALALVGALAMIVAYGEIHLFTADSYKALYVGRWIAQHGIPHTDTIAAANLGRPWVDLQWLAELVFYEAWRIGGYGLVALVAAGSIASAYMILAWVMRVRRIPAGWTVFFSVCAMFGLVRWGFVRAQDLALPLMASLLAICLTDSMHERPGRRLLLLPPLLALWANIHGSVLLGAGLAVLYLLWRAVTMARRGVPRSAAVCLAIAVLAALAPLATPYGPDIVHYYRQFGTAAQRLIGAEGRSPRFPGGAFFAVYVPLVLVVWLAIRGVVTRRPVPGLLLVACALTAIAAALRLGNMPWHAMVTALLVAELARPWLPVWAMPGWALRGITLFAVLVLVAVAWSTASRGAGAYEGDTAFRATGAAAASVARHPCWVILADNLDASALLWHDPWLDGRIAYDARAEVFTEPAMMRWAVFESGRTAAWSSTVAGYQLLLGNSAFGPELVRRLQQFSGGKVIARDRRGIAVLNVAAVRSPSSRCRSSH